MGPKERVGFPAAVACAMGIGTMALGIVFFAREVHHATPTQIGLLAATWSLCYILGCLLLRSFVDRLLPRHSILCGSLGMGLATGMIPWLHSLPAVFVCYALYGLSTSFFWPPLMGWLSTGLEGKALNRTMGHFNLCWSSGSIVGPALAGFLARHDPRWPIMAGAFLYLATAGYIVTALHTVRHLHVGDQAHRDAVASRPSSAATGAGTLLRFPSWAGLFAAYAVLGLIFNVFPLAAQDHLGFDKPTVGLLLFGRALATTATLLILGKTTRWHYRSGQLITGLLAFAVTVGLLPLSHSIPAVGFLLVLVGVFSAQSYANSLFHGVSGSHNRAARMAIHESLLSAGLICGGALGGLLYQHAGYNVLCLVAGTIPATAATIALIMTFVLVRKGGSSAYAPSA